MKKQLLALMSFVLITAVSYAGGESWSVRGKDVKAGAYQPAGATRADEGFIVKGYCRGYSNAIGQTGNLKAAIQIPEEAAQQLKGNKLTAVRIGFGIASNTNVTVYLSETLNGAPFYQQDATLPVKDGWNQVELDTPYEIDGSEFFIGYEFKNCRTGEYPIGLDDVITDNELGDYVWAQQIGWSHLGSMYGSVCIQGIIEGDNLPQNDVDIVDLQLPFSVKPSTPFSVKGAVINQGAAKVSDLTVEVTVDGKSVPNPSYVLSSTGLLPGESANVEIGGLQTSRNLADMEVKVKITQVNGQPNNSVDGNTASGYLSSFTQGVRRNMVVEEWTGAWCGWCVRGIVGMDYMKNKYGNAGFIGIAVHSDDRMQVSSYNEFLNEWALGFPGSAVNRSIVTDPNKEDLEVIYREVTATESFVDVTSVKADYSSADPNNLNVSADVVFTAPVENGDYRMAFVITEDQLGPYTQTNYYAGGTYGPMDGWENYPEKNYWMFNEVARRITDCMGIPESLPSDIAEKAVNSYSTTMSISNVKKIANCHLVAMVLSGRTGEIINASQISLYETGVEGVEAEKVTFETVPGGILVGGNIKECAIYDVQGRLVCKTSTGELAETGAGIFIVRILEQDGNTVTKKLVVR